MAEGSVRTQREGTPRKGWGGPRSCQIRPGVRPWRGETEHPGKARTSLLLPLRFRGRNRSAEHPLPPAGAQRVGSSVSPQAPASVPRLEEVPSDGLGSNLSVGRPLSSIPAVRAGTCAGCAQLLPGSPPRSARPCRPGQCGHSSQPCNSGRRGLEAEDRGH